MLLVLCKIILIWRALILILCLYTLTKKNWWWLLNNSFFRNFDPFLNFYTVKAIFLSFINCSTRPIAGYYELRCRFFNIQNLGCIFDGLTFFLNHFNQFDSILDIDMELLSKWLYRISFFQVFPIAAYNSFMNKI